MNASRPEADAEYSRGAGPAGVAPAPAALAGLAAAILVLAELTRLFTVRTIALHPRSVRTVDTGPHHGWALLPIAALTLVLAGLSRPGTGRAAAAGLGVLGLVTLGVALAIDLPAVHGTGLIGSPRAGLAPAQAHAGPGLYLETLGAIGLLIAGAAGLLLVPGGARRRWGNRHAGRDGASSPADSGGRSGV